MTIRRPAGNVDAALVATAQVQSAPFGAGLTIVEEAGLVLGNRHEEAAVRVVPHTVNEVAVIGGTSRPLEGRALKMCVDKRIHQ